MIIFRNHTLEKAWTYALKEYPVECCGVLLGVREAGIRNVYEVVPTPNMAGADENKTHFFINPFEFLRIERIASEKGWEIVGFYHSHPDYGDLASDEDISHMILGYSYPIFSIRQGSLNAVSSYEKISQDSLAIRKEKIKMEEEKMSVSVYLSATLRGFANRNAEVQITGENVKEILNHLKEQYPEMEKALFDENGQIRPFVNVYLNEENVTDEKKWDRAVKEGDALLFLPAIAGGAPVESVISDERRKAVSLDDSEIERYNKHLMLREIGVKGQKRIKAAKVIILGAGSLGSPVIQYLAAAGVGKIKVVDFDEVTLGNLQSQVIHGTRDVHRPKIASARDKIKAINPKIQIEAVNEKVDAENIAELIEDYDIVVDCTDNYKSRYLINDACVLAGKPLVFGAIYQFEGQVSVFDASKGPCYRCQFPAPPPSGLVPTCAEGGAISPLPGIIGSIQANEVLKLIVGSGKSLHGKLLSVDTWNLRVSILPVHKRENCPICGKNASISEIQEFDYDDFCGLKQREDEIPVEGIEADELALRIERGDPLTIVDVREPHERAINRFPNAIVIPIGQLARRQKELDPDVDTIFICKEGKRSILAINTLREAGYKGPMYNLKGGVDAAKNIIFSNEGAWL